MAVPLLETKLHVPRRRRGLVPRPRLTERLSRGAESALTLVSAPAGFGKTTLLTEWLAAARAEGQYVAWVSLDERDNDPALFWSYLVAALNAAAGHGADAGALPLLESSQQSSEAVLAALLNDLDAVSNDVVLVLDEYHVIEAPGVQDGMAFLLEHLPPQVHVVIATRADPPWPLARWRARGELVEIRVADLRFTPEEAAAYLNEAMGLALPPRDVAALHERTEGWIAALQLAALSMQGRDDVAGFIADFAGDDRYIVDYLVEEVLQRQPEHVRSFLLHTCVLSRLSGSLCDAVTGQGGGKAMLEALVRANLFLVPLDDRRQWYRYHLLFAHVLRARLLDEQPDRVRELHRRASDWHEQNGERSEAIDHALAAEDFEQAADLIELAIPAMRRSRSEATLRGWFDALPRELLRIRPVLSVGLVGGLMARGEVERAEGPLRDAERWLEPTVGGEGPGPAESGERVVVDEEGYRRLPGTIQMYRAAQALARGDVPGTVSHARRAIELSPDDDHLNRAAAAGFLGLASWASGDLDAAESAYAQCMAGLRRAGHDSDVFGAASALADIRLAQGRLGAAMRAYQQALQGVPEHAGSALLGTADMHVGMSQVHRERNDLDAARQDLQRSEQLGEHTGVAAHRHRWRLAAARLREAEGDLDGALELLDEAERLYDGSDFFPNARPIPAMRARVLAARGDLGEALGWARDRGLSVDDGLSYLREFEHITLCRVLLARAAQDRAKGLIGDASRLLARLLSAAEEGGRTGSVIEILVLQALTRRMVDDMPAALAALERAVTLAEPEGYVRVFADEGPPMASLLRAAARQGIARDYVRRVLAAVSDSEHRGPAEQGLVDPLSDRELEVLRLLATDLSGPDIARELVVSLNTVRTHVKHIYAKLGVNSRRAAVRQAEQLDLPSRSRGR